MLDSISIKLENICKSYKIYSDKRQTLKEKMLFKSNKKSVDSRKVLKDISFSVNKGEPMGIIGKNGCGKSTLLKLLSKIIYPDSGDIQINGRVSSLIELGAGFHPDMSGRENLYTNASILGLEKKEIDKRFENILEFSELREFIDNPVRTYSSGMYLRLAFSVAVNVEPDILLIDEILSVGDINFQKKSFNKIKEIKKNGTTIVIVSHSLGQIEELCSRCIWLDNGYVREIGDSKEIRLRKYYNEINKENSPIKIPDFCNSLSIINGNKKIEFIDVCLSDSQNNKKNIFNTSDDIYINLKYKSNSEDNLYVDVSFCISNMQEIMCYSTNVYNETRNLVFVKHDDVNYIKIKINKSNLIKNRYMLNVGMSSEQGEIYHEIQRVLFFDVISENHDVGICRLETEWII